MMQDGMERSLRWDACLNVRDLGGLPTVGGRRMRWGALVRADLLCRLTETGLAEVRRHGVRTVIDLRSAAEAAHEPNPFAAAGPGEPDYRNLPVEDDADRASRTPSGTDLTAAELYQTSLDANRARFAGIAAGVARAVSGGVLLHCHAGKDRTGLVVALLLALVGVTDEEIAIDYALSGANVEALAREWLDRVARTPAERVRLLAQAVPHREVMDATLAHLHGTHGGAEAYLRAGGLADDEVAALRTRLLD